MDQVGGRPIKITVVPGKRVAVEPHAQPDLNQPRALADVTREIEINLGGPVRMVQQFCRTSKRGRPS